MATNNILVIGSSNTDMVIKSSRLPAPGETILGGDFLMNPGGKGANQAVAAARLGGSVNFITKVGIDIFGQAALEGLERHGINITYINKDENTPSGVALIMVDGQGENSISVALGANNTLSKSDLDNANKAFEKADYVLMQLEIPLEAIQYATQLAFINKAKVNLNPAPAQNLPDDLVAKLYCITPNETEATLLTGIKVTDDASAHQAALALRAKGVSNVIITMGSKGAYILNDELATLIPTEKVNAVDTTAAGDTFNGALVVGLSKGWGFLEAITFANKAAAYSVTKMGAQASTPTLEDLGM